MKRRVGVTHVYRKFFSETDKENLEERIYFAVKKLLEESGRKIQEMECISISSNDQIDGRAISIMASSGSVGGVNRDIIDAPSAGEHSLIIGYMKVLSGLYNSSLIVTWNVNEIDDMESVQNITSDPIFQRRLQINDLCWYALQASAYTQDSKVSQEEASQIVVKNRNAATENLSGYIRHKISVDEIFASEYVSWPIKKLMLPQKAKGIVVMIVASEDKIEDWGLDKKKVAWIDGVGWASESYWFSDNKIKSLTSLKIACAQAYEQANIINPCGEISVVEIHDPTPYYEIMSYEALGLCKENKCKDFLNDILSGKNALIINPSGGSHSGNAFFATGMMRVAEAALQVIGKAGNHQGNHVQKSLATATSGSAGQNNSVFIFSRGNEE